MTRWCVTPQLFTPCTVCWCPVHYFDIFFFFVAFQSEVQADVDAIAAMVTEKREKAKEVALNPKVVVQEPPRLPVAARTTAARQAHLESTVADKLGKGKRVLPGTIKAINEGAAAMQQVQCCCSLLLLLVVDVGVVVVVVVRLGLRVPECYEGALLYPAVLWVCRIGCVRVCEKLSVPHRRQGVLVICR